MNCEDRKPGEIWEYSNVPWDEHNRYFGSVTVMVLILENMSPKNLSEIFILERYVDGGDDGVFFFDQFYFISSCSKFWRRLA